MKAPGHLQADTVAHCGNSLSGTFIWSLTVTDEFSGWTVNRASFGKSATRVVGSIMSSLTNYPFEIEKFNTDSGLWMGDRTLGINFLLK